ncbi:MAG: rhodanese family protein [Pseudomonadota bacterium]
MSTLTKIKPHDAASKLEDGTIHLVDIREADEFAREHVPGAHSLPLSTLEAGDARLPDSGRSVFMCRSGNRTDINCSQLAIIAGDAMVLEGGLDAWRSAGLPTELDKSAPLEIMRQVQITAGSLVLLGVILGTLVHPGFYGLAAFIGAGLTFAGVSGWCGMAKMLSALPWNRPQTA